MYLFCGVLFVYKEEVGYDNLIDCIKTTVRKLY